MANTTNPKGFELAPDSPVKIAVERMVAASETIKEGDRLYLNNVGNITLTASTYPIAGVAAGPIMDGTTRIPKDTSAATAIDVIKVWTTECHFIGQITTGALTDEYTCFTASSRFDVAGTTGVMYIDAGATALDECEIMGVATEPNGGISQFGAYQKKVFRFSPDHSVILRSNVTSKRFV